ncbi:HNH endonuclease signature motif containing protein [Aliiroseovarius sp. YM-037]|uniref:HNH endonuclease signature motif containing protein n=1 Tax=Aliiroseovarius sp. YM-037 TaxID=3341728 RepID=UPI003A7FDE43
MKDVEYVEAMLSTEYETEHSNEIPYPKLDEVIGGTTFEYLAGRVEGETPNGSKSREGHDYLWFKYDRKSILSHRFIAAITLEKWIPRDFDVDHINHNPSDNRPINLRIVTRRDNAGNRRTALLSELADLKAVSLALKERKPAIKPEPKPEPLPVSVSPPPDVSFDEPVPQTIYTGETKPATHGGKWHKTKVGSWHLIFD